MICNSSSTFTVITYKCTWLWRVYFPSWSSLFLTGGSAHVHVCVIMRGRYGWWRHGHWKSLALGMWGVRPGQGVCGGITGRLWGHLVASCRRRAGGWAARSPRLEVAFWWGWRSLVKLDGDVAGGLRGAASTFWWRPGGVWLEELAAIVAALGQAGAVERRVGAVHLFFCITFHEQIDWHHTGPLKRWARLHYMWQCVFCSETTFQRNSNE